jgi:PTH1 family peptidyl-tRNA hydrolase
MFFKRKSSGMDGLIVGLGNPGKKYEGTRHNVGFMALDATAADFGIAVKRGRFEALCGDGTVDGFKVTLLKPQTFMNLSGKSVRKAAEYYGVAPERVVVLCDDVNLAVGALRIRLSGSAGGQKGLADIIAALGENVPRVRIGVGEKPHPDYDLADWVLGRFTAAEQKAVAKRCADVPGALRLLLAGRASDAMSAYNGEGKGL